MEKRILINNKISNYWIEDNGKIRNEKTKRYLKGYIKRNGYHVYKLSCEGEKYNFYTHKLVAKYFIPNPKNLPIVHHKDGNLLNNACNNLEWIPSVGFLQRNISNSNKKNANIRIDLKNYDNIAQFRDSPYYATTEGEIININKRTKLKLDDSTINYLSFRGSYNLNKKHFFVHRVVWEAFNGEIPKGYNIDHIDGNLKNNCLNNLRLMLHSDIIKRRNIDYSYAKYNFYYDD